jgi:hypothetical protein
VYVSNQSEGADPRLVYPKVTRMNHPIQVALMAFIVLWLGTGPTRADERIMVENAKVNGRPVKLAFDTGADGIYLFTPAVERLGLKVAPIHNLWRQKIGTETEKCIVQFWSFTEKQRVNVIALPLDLCDFGEIDGLVGWEAMENNIMVFETASNTVQFVRELPAEVKQWPRFKLSWDTVLDIKVPNQGQTGRLLIDTGSPSGFGLPAASWRAWKAAHPLQPVTFESSYMPGPQQIVAQEQAWASEFTLGPLSFHDVVMEEAEPFSGRGVGRKHLATLGLAAMKRLDLVIDGPSGWAYIRPKKTPAPPPQHNRLGATFLPRDLASDALLARVAAGSPADEAGIRPGDELLKIGAEDVTNWRTTKRAPGNHWERPAGTQVLLTLQRSNQIYQTTVTLRDILSSKAHQP